MFSVMRIVVFYSVRIQYLENEKWNHKNVWILWTLNDWTWSECIKTWYIGAILCLCEMCTKEIFLMKLIMCGNDNWINLTKRWNAHIHICRYMHTRCSRCLWN